jgi:hypothetical protein
MQPRNTSLSFIRFALALETSTTGVRQESQGSLPDDEEELSLFFSSQGAKIQKFKLLGYTAEKTLVVDFCIQMARLQYGSISGCEPYTPNLGNEPWFFNPISAAAPGSSSRGAATHLTQPPGRSRLPGPVRNLPYHLLFLPVFQVMLNGQELVRR